MLNNFVSQTICDELYFILSECTALGKLGCTELKISKRMAIVKKSHLMINQSITYSVRFSLCGQNKCLSILSDIS